VWRPEPLVETQLDTPQVAYFERGNRADGDGGVREEFYFAIAADVDEAVGTDVKELESPIRMLPCESTITPPPGATLRLLPVPIVRYALGATPTRPSS
jgi:hypothetical protein